MTLDDRIDELYRLPLAEFTTARNALAKSLKKSDAGEDTKRIRGLTKPTLVPWAVNQLFWNARLVYERLMKCGEVLRAAQIAALSSRAPAKPGDVERAAAAHRDAIAEAVRQATRLAGAGGAKPDVDELSRTLESLSLAPSRLEHPGRLTEPVRPAGFEALAGVAGSLVGSGSLAGSGFSRMPPTGMTPTVATAPAKAEAHKSGRITPTGAKAQAKTGAHGSRAANAEAVAPKEISDAQRAEDAKRALAEAAAARQREVEFEAQKLKAEAALGSAQQDFERCKAAEARAREALDHAERAREEAHERLVAARKFLTSNF